MSLPPIDYDGAWKRAIQQYCAPFLELFFPQVHAGIDWGRPISFRETELQQIAPEDQAGKQRADLLVEVVQRDGAPALVLIDVYPSGRETHPRSAVGGTPLLQPAFADTCTDVRIAVYS